MIVILYDELHGMEATSRAAWRPNLLKKATKDMLLHAFFKVSWSYDDGVPSIYAPNEPFNVQSWRS